MFMLIFLCYNLDNMEGDTVMKNSYTNINHRREAILQLLEDTVDNTLDVNSIASEMNVSAMTIRRDLNILEDMGKIIREHGGAKLNENQQVEGQTYNSSLEKIKALIAEQAAKYIENNNTLFINSSSTALSTINFLNDKTLTVVTNNLRINKDKVNPSTSILLPGGEIRYPKEALVGDLCVSNLSNIHADITVIGCSGISAEKGLSTNNIHESRVNNVMINNATKLVIVTADYRKIGSDSSFIVSDLSNIDILITDIYANPEAIRGIEDAGVIVIQISAE